mgnify:CR=1 FL=1
MNESGPVVAKALRRAEAGPADVILVYDDIDLPLGTVRVRMKGSHGGHNGVRSVIDALGTQDIKRVKVGVGRPDHKGDVLTTCSPRSSTTSCRSSTPPSPKRWKKFWRSSADRYSIT